MSFGNGSASPLATRRSGVQPLLLEVGACERDGRLREVDAGADGASLGEACEIDGGTASDFEDRLAAIPIEVDQPQQVVQLLEVIVVEIVEEATRPDRVTGDFEIVNVLFPGTRGLRRRSPRCIL
ncbi:MAG: hypothetical protein QM736_04245 [Vicinamibacterales bacterium]